MDLTRPNNLQTLVTLQEASIKMGVSVDTLLQWNEYNILKPTITPLGTVGYTQDQIDQFLCIQQTFKRSASGTTNLPQDRSPLTSLPQATVQGESHPKDTLSFNGSNRPKSPTMQRFFRLSLPISAVGFVLLVAILVQSGELKSVLNQYQNQVAGSAKEADQTSSADVTIPVRSTLAAQTRADNELTKNSQESNTSVFAAKPPISPTPKKLTAAEIGTQPNKSLIATVAAIITSLQPKTAYANHQNTPTLPDGSPINTSTTYASTVTRNPNAQNPNSTFDQNGNITGKTDALATILGGTGTLGDETSPLQPSANTRNQAILVTICALGALVYFLKKPQKPTVRPAVEKHPSNATQKILEIDQKMDGTVVLSFQGKDYKISKPELHSDSDQFIERLMALSQPGNKEIEYDNFTDEKIKLTTPLSRLVTRLGFVGLKRDLFFPRTSKHNVLFRKYITQEDLLGMHLTVDQIFNDLAIVS